MRLNHFAFNIIFIITGVVLVDTCLAEPNWNGTYIYETSMGKTVGGSEATMKFKLYISPSKCLFSIDGFQTMERIICKPESNNSHINIKFKSYENGSLKNDFGIQIYKPNETLFELKKSSSILITTWQAERPDDNLPKKGVYFKIKP